MQLGLRGPWPRRVARSSQALRAACHAEGGEEVGERTDVRDARRSGARRSGAMRSHVAARRRSPCRSSAGYVKKVDLRDQGRPRRGLQGLLHQEPAGGLGGRRRRHHRAHPLPRPRVVDFEDDPQGTVYDNYPGAAKGGSPVSSPSAPTAQSPKGWVDPTGLVGTGVTTYGNNADTYANWSNFIGAGRQRPAPGLPDRQLQLHLHEPVGGHQGRRRSRRPTPQDLNPAATNLFFQHNRIHDEYYALGFTETAGNFQLDNGSNGGMGGDPIRGLVQAGAASGGARPTPVATTPTCSPSTTASRRGAACSSGSRSTTRSRARTATARST